MREMKIEKVMECMESIAPSCVALDFDNVGLLAGRRDADVHKILTALDCTPGVVREAVSLGAEMIVCHHPLLFSGAKRITNETAEGRVLLAAIENRVAIFAAHTNLDFAEGGLNDFFLEKIGCEMKGTIAENEGRLFDAGGVTVKAFCERLKEALDIKYIRTSMSEDELLFRGALCTGGGKSLAGAVLKKADFYISGDLGHHDICLLRDNNVGFIEISHYDSEKIVMQLLKERLDEKLGGEAEVFVSKADANPMHVII